jgi:hypothetical protein
MSFNTNVLIDVMVQKIIYEAITKIVKNSVIKELLIETKEETNEEFLQVNKEYSDVLITTNEHVELVEEKIPISTIFRNFECIFIQACDNKRNYSFVLKNNINNNKDLLLFFYINNKLNIYNYFKSIKELRKKQTIDIIDLINKKMKKNKLKFNERYVYCVGEINKSSVVELKHIFMRKIYIDK